MESIVDVLLVLVLLCCWIIAECMAHARLRRAARDTEEARKLAQAIEVGVRQGWIRAIR